MDAYYHALIGFVFGVAFAVQVVYLILKKQVIIMMTIRELAEWGERNNAMDYKCVYTRPDYDYGVIMIYALDNATVDPEMKEVNLSMKILECIEDES